MNNVFLVFFYFFKSWIIFLRSSKLITKKQFAAHSLFQTTFRIPQSERSKILLVPFKYVDFLKTIFLKKRNNDHVIISEKTGGIYVYDVLNSSYKQRKDYVNYFAEEKICGGIFKSELYFCSSISETFFLFVIGSFFMPFLFANSLFKKDKAPYALILKEIVETITLINLIKKEKITKLYFFSIYEKDSNICTLILQKLGVKVYKIPSEVPLGLWNKIVLADGLCICNAYQQEEVKELEDSIFVDEFYFWGPERALDNISKYNQPVSTTKKTIGFYSTGTWVRELENHINQGIDMQSMEADVKRALKMFFIAKPEYKLKIFLHPREKWPKYIDKTIEKYNKDFEGINFELVENTVKSSYSFELVDLGIAFQSTIVYERLYYGFKTILMPIGYDNFPFPNSSMENVCVKSEIELFEKIESSMKLTNTQFFDTNGIRKLAKFLFN